MSNTKIVRLNASALYALGMDRPTVEALINGLRITGNDTAGVTVPQLSEQVDTSSGVIKDIQQTIVLIQMNADALASAPVPVSTPAEDYWKTLPSPVHQSAAATTDQTANEGRHAAEQLGALAKIMMDMQLMLSEVRQIASFQAQMSTTIDDLKQGTML